MTLIIFFIFLGIVTAIVGTLSGGGGLISLPLFLYLGVPIHSAIASNKFSNTFHSLLSIITLIRREKLNIKSFIPVVPLLLFGGSIGAAIASTMSEHFLTVLAITLLCSALLLSSLRKQKEWPTKKKNHYPKTIYPFQFFISVYDGTFGPGSGTLLFHLFYYFSFSYIEAISIARIQTFLSCLGAAITFFLFGHIIWEIALPYAVGGLIGSQIALKIAPTLSSNKIKLLINGMTLCIILSLLYKYF
jgi:uncharacterized protein